ncbi:MAG: alpha-amylase family glycosyl hydrolase [Planctomycetota bacterium]
MKTCLAAFVFVSAASVGAGEFSFSNGGLELVFDDATGALLRISYKGEAIAVDAKGRSPVSFGAGPQGEVKYLENLGPRRVTARAQPAPGTLELTVRAGDYELIERYKLHTGVARVDRSVTLANRGAEAVKLRGFTFYTYGLAAPKDGFYRFPQQWPPAGHPFAKMQPGQKHGRGGSIAPVVAQLSPSRSVLWLSFATDPAWTHVQEGEGQFDMAQGLQAEGFLRPNQPQEVGFVSMQIVEAGYWEALPALWQWMDSAGLKVPADRPQWVEEAVLYCFHPGGTIGSNFKDLGGFKNATEYLLPTISKLGATAIWIMPIEQKSPYWPFDYYKFMDGLGTAEDYKALVKTAHELGLHVWQDLVPHGGSPQAVHNQAHPEFMLHREDGSHLNYWLNDFAWPEWQKYIAGVAAHYAKEYGVDGYRVDACGGSKEPNWNPDIPYARASHALLWGGLGMLRGIRQAVKEVSPRDGAILAEAENARLLEVADAEYDFGFCYNVCQQWRKEPAADFVAHLQEYLEEQKYAEPRGTVRLRHVESHDSLRAELWYGVDGMRAMYALSAWSDGIPLIYHGMETGHSFALKDINATRKKHPALARGEAFYRTVQCDAPGVFTCLRKLGDEQAVVAINFNRDEVKAKLAWPGKECELALKPLQYTIAFPQAVPVEPPAEPPAALPPLTRAPVAGVVAFPGAQEWFADTISGRLRDEFNPPPKAWHVSVRTGWSGGIYWQKQGTGVLWENLLNPLWPAHPRLGVKYDKGGWTLFDYGAPVANYLQLVDHFQFFTGLHLNGPEGLRPTETPAGSAPPAPETWRPITLAGVSFRCVGPDIIVSNPHYTVVLRRQGGVVRELSVPRASRPPDAGGTPALLVAKDHDLYGDQEYLKPHDGDRIAAGDDVECNMRIKETKAGLRLSFEGQLRGFQRFALKRPPILYRNEYVFTDGPNFHQRYGFRTEKSFTDVTAFLASIVQLPGAERFRIARGNETVTEDEVGHARERRGLTACLPAPDRIEFLAGGKKQWGLSGLSVPKGSNCKLFVDGRQFFITFLDGKGAGMEQGRWYEFEVDWVSGE